MPTLHCQDLSTAANMSINTVVTIATPFSLQVKSGISNCTIENLTELAIECHNRLPTMIVEAYDKTNQALLGDCPGPQRHECRWLQQILVLKECSDTELKEALQPPYNTTSLQ